MTYDKKVAWAFKLILSIVAIISLQANGQDRNLRDLIAESVGIIEWQFPIAKEQAIQVNPLQESLLNSEDFADLRPAFYPTISELNEDEPDYVKQNLGQHGRDVYHTYTLSNAKKPQPFLINLSESTPEAIQTLIRAGVNIFSMSAAIRDIEWEAFESVIKNNPEVVFFVSTAHIAGNTTSLRDLNETPSRLALQGYDNVILVGCLEYYQYHVEAHLQGKKLGSQENPFVIDNQPTEGFGQYHLMRCNSVRHYVDRFGGTSAASPVLARLATIAVQKLKAKGKPVNKVNILDALDQVMHRTYAKSKGQKLRSVQYFTLDTLLGNLEQPQLGQEIWAWDFTDFIEPKLFQF